MEESRQNDERLDRYDRICYAAHVEVQAALKEMEKCCRANNHAGWVDATHDFHKGLALYDLAELVLMEGRQ